MNRFVFVALLVMAWGYWELSGGAEFVPEERLAQAVAQEPAPAPQVTRADTTELDQVPAVAAVTPIVEAPAAEVITLTEPEIEAVVDAVVEEAAAETVVEPVAEPAPAAPPVADLRVVTGDQVNLREGPGTDFAAIDRLGSGTILEVIESGADGWVRIRVQGTSLSGWMSARFLTPLNG